ESGQRAGVEGISVLTLEIPMSPMRKVCVVAMFAVTEAAHGQSSTATTESASATPAVENGIPVTRLVSQVGHRTHKKFIVDPRIRADIALGDLSLSDLTYNDLEEILFVNGYTLFEHGNYVEVLPNANARQSAVAVISGKETRPDHEIV